MAFKTVPFDPKTIQDKRHPAHVKKWPLMQHPTIEKRPMDDVNNYANSYPDLRNVDWTNNDVISEFLCLAYRLRAVAYYLQNDAQHEIDGQSLLQTLLNMERQCLDNAVLIDGAIKTAKLKKR